MNWFRFRSKGKRISPARRRLCVEEMEPRLTTNLMWMPGPGIDITGIQQSDPSIFFAKGQSVDFSIIGSGLDWDNWFDMSTMTTGVALDTVTIHWSIGGPSSQNSTTGTQFSLAMNDAGWYNINLAAVDGGITPAGDIGSRQDTPVVIGAAVAALWVDPIVVASQGQMDSDTPHVAPHELTFANDIGHELELGGTENTTTGKGLALKVELTGTVTPSVPDGTSGFNWRQELDVRWCYHRPFGGGEIGAVQFRDESAESVGEHWQSNETKNSKLFEIDDPRWVFDQLASPVDYNQVNTYWNFTTWVNFNGVQASGKFKWQVSMQIRSDGMAWQVGLSSQSPAEPGQNTNGPTGDPQSGSYTEPGIIGFQVDCSNQVW